MLKMDIFVNIVRTVAVITYCCLLTFSVAINCYLLYLTLKRRYIRHRQYSLILTNLAVCDILIAITPSVFLLPSVVHRGTVILSKWCLTFLPVFGNFMIATLLTWTLLSAERYIFICHGIHYLRIMTQCNTRWALAVIWTLVLLLNAYYEVLLDGKIDFSARTQLDTLMCDPLTLLQLRELTFTDMWLLRMPPACVLLSSVICIFTCYFCIYRAARKASVALRRSNRRAAVKVGCYLVMFLVQGLPCLWCIVMGIVYEFYPGIYPQSQVLLLFLMTTTPSANALTAIHCNMKLRRALLRLCCHRVRGAQGVAPEGDEMEGAAATETDL